MTSRKTGPVAAEMLARLNSALSPTRIELIDDSEQHRGHGGYNPAGESHFSLRIESDAFAGKRPIELLKEGKARDIIVEFRRLQSGEPA